MGRRSLRRRRVGVQEAHLRYAVRRGQRRVRAFRIVLRGCARADLRLERTAGRPSAGVSSNSLLLALALAKVALHLAVIRGYGIFRDEMYLVDCARRLAWGYVDHPPLAPAVLRMAMATLGDSVFAIRLPAALAGGVLVFLTGWIAREL